MDVSEVCFILYQQQEQLLGVLKNLLTSSDMRKDKEMARSTWEKDLGHMVWEKGIFLLSLMRASSMPVRLIAIKVGVASIGLCCEINSVNFFFFLYHIYKCYML